MFLIGHEWCFSWVFQGDVYPLQARAIVMVCQGWRSGGGNERRGEFRCHPHHHARHKLSTPQRNASPKGVDSFGPLSEVDYRSTAMMK